MSRQLYTIIHCEPVALGEHGSMLFELANKEFYCCPLLEPFEGVATLIPELSDGTDGEEKLCKVVAYACDFTAGSKVWLDPESENFIDEPFL
jgi:hypothetical protein